MTYYPAPSHIPLICFEITHPRFVDIEIVVTIIAIIITVANNDYLDVRFDIFPIIVPVSFNSIICLLKYIFCICPILNRLIAVFNFTGS
jgi:hypothetical protein